MWGREGGVKKQDKAQLIGKISTKCDHLPNMPEQRFDHSVPYRSLQKSNIMWGLPTYLVAKA